MGNGETQPREALRLEMEHSEAEKKSVLSRIVHRLPARRMEQFVYFPTGLTRLFVIQFKS